MSESNGAADAAAVAATPVQSTGTPASNTQAQPDGEAWRNPKEIKDYFQRVQRLESQLGEALTLLKGRTPEQPPSKPASEVDTLRADLAFRDLVADVAPNLDRGKRERLQRLYSLEKPTDPEAWVRSEVAVFGWDKPATAPAAPAPIPAQVKQATNAGTPGVGSRGIDPSTLTREDISALSGPDLRAAFESIVNRDPSAGNMFAPRTKP